jgi:hypothetical protein
MKVHPSTAAYRTLTICFRNDIRSKALSNAAQDGVAHFFLSATLAQTFNNRSSELTRATITVLALAEPFIAAGAAVAFIRCFLLFFKGSHGLVVPPRHWYFFPTEKGKAPAAMSGMKL